MRSARTRPDALRSSIAQAGRNARRVAGNGVEIPGPRTMLSP